MSHFKKQLNAFQLWAITVGTVISGQLFGWNYALHQARPLELTLGFLIVGIFYLTFIFCCAELASSIPYAGGASQFVQKAFGPFWGCLTGFAILMEFGFGVPAIAVAAGSYIHFLWPMLSVQVGSVCLLIIFIGANVLGTKSVAVIEIVATVFALISLLPFYYFGIAHIHLPTVKEKMVVGGSFHWHTLILVLPFLCWIYLGVEGGAMAAEEMTHAHKQMGRGLCWGMVTLFILSFFTVFIVYSLQNVQTSMVDFPLLQVLSHFYGEKGFITLIISTLGLFGLMASLNGLIICYSRQVFALSREGFLPTVLSKMTKKQVPVNAILFPGIFMLTCCFSAKLADALVGLSVFGATVMYCLTLLAHIVLRIKAPHLHRPFKTWFPFVPFLSLLLGLLCIYAIIEEVILKNSLDFFGAKLPLIEVCGVFFIVAILVFLRWQWMQRKLVCMR